MIIKKIYTLGITLTIYAALLSAALFTQHANAATTTAAACGTHASGTTYSIYLGHGGDTTGSKPATLAQCPLGFGGTQATVTTYFQTYKCVDGTQTAVGAQWGQTTDTYYGLKCNTAPSAAITTAAPATTASSAKFGAVTLSLPVVYPTNQLQITSTLTAGSVALTNLQVQTTITNSDGTVFNTTTQTVASLSAGASKTVTSSFTVPSNTAMPAGTYTVSVGALGATTGQQTATFTVPAATTTLNEAFNDGRTSLDTNIWNNAYQWDSIINDEAEIYVPDALSIVPNQGLRIRADKRSFEGQPYTSGVLTTAASFSQTYGHFEMLAKLPTGAGTWPAFWMEPADSFFSNTISTIAGEIDIFEHLGYLPTYIFQTLHTSGGQSLTCETGIDWTQAYHVYAIDWKPGSLVWTIDGKHCNTQTTNIPNGPMYIMANLAIGGSGSWGGAPNASTPFPSYMDIAYIKVWQYAGMPAELEPNGKFAGVSITPEVLKPGDSFTITGTIAAGSEGMKAGIPPAAGQPWNRNGLHFTIYAGSALYQKTFDSPAIAANSTAPFTMTGTIPSTWAPGMYHVSVSVNSGNGVNASVGIANIIVGNPLPPLP